MKQFRNFIIFIVIFIIAVILLIAHGNSDLQIREFSIKSEKIPEVFNGFRIAQVSDLHNTEFGDGNKKLVEKLQRTDADIIVITGDIIDSNKTDVSVALAFAKEAIKLAPTYYVNGNHEAAKPAVYKKLKEGFAEIGIIMLEDSSVDIKEGNDFITLVGINDPLFETENRNTYKRLENVIPHNENYKILLAHRPEYFDTYAEFADLTLSGHAHGGQFIVPFAGGIVAPGQGFFPEFYDGLYSNNDSNMIVSRGIGNSIIPFRINNKPEIIVVKLIR